MNYLHYCSNANHEEFIHIPRYEKTTMSIPDDVYRELAEQIREALGDGEILQKQIYTEIGESGVVLRAEVTCIANIAAVQEFEIDVKDNR